MVSKNLADSNRLELELSQLIQLAESEAKQLGLILKSLSRTPHSLVMKTSLKHAQKSESLYTKVINIFIFLGQKYEVLKYKAIVEQVREQKLAIITKFKKIASAKDIIKLIKEEETTKQALENFIENEPTENIEQAQIISDITKYKHYINQYLISSQDTELKAIRATELKLWARIKHLEHHKNLKSDIQKELSVFVDTLEKTKNDILQTETFSIKILVFLKEKIRAIKSLFKN